MRTGKAEIGENAIAHEPRPMMINVRDIADLRLAITEDGV